ncbi:MAG: hypothetical protein Q4D94_10655 [Bacillota bacterium]|nr:hypothetical protein [Bacillota bacterium]
MIYTLCWEENNFVRDIKVNRAQKIAETITVLKDGSILPPDLDIEKIRIFSKRKGEYINKKASYEQEEIFQGDILYIR